MSMTFVFSSNGTTSHYEDGQRVYPCHCGATHRGQYAAEDYAHHACLHAEFMLLGPEYPLQIACLYCGKVAELVSEISKNETSL